MAFDILPLYAVGPVRLGAERDEVIGALGTPCQRIEALPGRSLAMDAWLEGRFEVLYAGGPARVCQVRMHLDPRFAPRLFGLHVFAMRAPVLLSRIAAHTRCAVQQHQAGMQVAFAPLGLGLLRADARDDYFSTIQVGRA